jgi:uncharacterized membrane protein
VGTVATVCHIPAFQQTQSAAAIIAAIIRVLSCPKEPAARTVNRSRYSNATQQVEANVASDNCRSQSRPSDTRRFQARHNRPKNSVYS